MENGYAIWDFRGRQLYKQNLEKMYFFQWRPRCPTILSAEQISVRRYDRLRGPD